MKYAHHPKPVWLKVLHQAKCRHQLYQDIVSTMARFTADTLQSQYGDELARPPLSDAKTPRMLHKALLERNPPLDISDGISLIGITHVKYEDLPHRKVSILCNA